EINARRTVGDAGLQCLRMTAPGHDAAVSRVSARESRLDLVQGTTAQHARKGCEYRVRQRLRVALRGRVGSGTVQVRGRWIAAPPHRAPNHQVLLRRKLQVEPRAAVPVENVRALVDV